MKRLLFLLLLLVFLFSYVRMASALPASMVGVLQWQPKTDLNKIDGYYVYWFDSETSYSDGRQEVDKTLNQIELKNIIGLGSGRCFSITVFKGDVESDFSDPVCFPSSIGLEIKILISSD